MPHHGSCENGSDSKDFISTTSPLIGIFSSDGDANLKYQHPKSKSVDNLKTNTKLISLTEEIEFCCYGDLIEDNWKNEKIIVDKDSEKK